ncbi:MAG TPA: hypothetical protein VF661_10850 [Actinomycetales bacterium]
MADQRQVGRQEQFVRQREIDRRWEQARAAAERSARAEVERIEALLVRMDRTKQSTSVRNLATRLGTARHGLRQSLTLGTWRAHLRATGPERYAALKAELESD